MKVAIRARFPKLAAALGESGFELMLASFMEHEPEAQRSLSTTDAQLPQYLAHCADYPVWYAELASLDRAHVHVLHAPRVPVLGRKHLAPEHELKLVPAHALVSLTTTVDELWASLDHAAEEGLPRARVSRPRALDWPRTVLIARREGSDIMQRTLEPDETAALKAAVRGTSLVELAAGLGGVNPHARALDLVLRWIDDGVLVE